MKAFYSGHPEIFLVGNDDIFGELLKPDPLLKRLPQTYIILNNGMNKHCCLEE